MRVVCVVNPRAGPRRDRSVIPEALHRAALTMSWQNTIILTEHAGHATEIAREMREMTDIVVAVGGDGTVREVAVGLLGGSAALGIIPQGSGNGLARSLGIPCKYQHAIESLTRGVHRQIDVGYVNDIPFVLTAGIGFDAQVGHRFAQGKHSRGLLPYLVFCVQEWFRFQPQQVRITVGGQTRQERPLLLVVANGTHYGYGAQIAPDARTDDGVFLVATLDKTSAFRTILTLPKLFTGNLPSARAYHAESTNELVVERDEPGLIQVDGEPMIADATLRFAIKPSALAIWLPPE